jgi:NYN domain
VLAERPEVVVIASSDSDFAPLVQRLREKGCVVRGIGQQGKTGDETRSVYDDFTVLEHRVGRAAVRANANANTNGDAPARSVATRAGSRRRSPAAVHAVVHPDVTAAAFVEPVAAAFSEAVPAGAVPPLASKRTRKSASAQPRRAVGGAAQVLEQPTPPAPVQTHSDSHSAAGVTVAGHEAPAAVSPGATAQPKTRGTRRGRNPAPPDATPAAPPRGRAVLAEAPLSVDAALQSVLDCLPELLNGQPLALNVAVQRLREAQVLSRHRSSAKLFQQLAGPLELLPTKRPSQVRLRIP